MAQTFERTALYGEVWSTPLTKLGLKYGLSDNGIRKICKTLSIPLPKVGHWAKIAAGQAIRRPRLPEHDGPDSFVSHATPSPERQSEYATVEDEKWLEARLAFETSPDGGVVVRPTVARWHPAISPLHRATEVDVDRYRKSLRERDKQRALPPDPDGMIWGLSAWRYLDEGLLYEPHGPRTCLRVSVHTYQRALSIFNALAAAASSRGCIVEVEESRDYVRFRLEGALFSAALRERAKAPEGAQRAAGDAPLERRLALVVSMHPGGEFQIVDGKRRLEDQLGEFFPRLYRTVVAARERDREDRARAMRQIRYREEAAALAAQQAAEEAARQAAAEREDRLLREAADWQKAVQIRGYVDAVSSGAGGASAVAAWQAWALATADRLDPLQNPDSTFRTHPQ